MIIKVETIEQFLEVVPLIIAYAKQPRACIALDVETYGPDKTKVPRPTKNKDGSYNGYIRTLQIGFDLSEAFAIRDIQIIIDIKKTGCEIITKYLKEVFENTFIIGQNLKYEYQFLWVFMGIKLKKMRDVMLMSQILKAGDKVHHGLGDLYARYFDYGWFESYLASKLDLKALMKAYFVEGQKPLSIFDLYKRFKDVHQKIDWEIDEMTPEQLQYAADDVALIFPLFDAISDEVKRWRATYEPQFVDGTMGMIEVIKKECDLIPRYAIMELRGVKLDKDYQERVVIKYLQEKMKEATEKLAFTVTKKVKHRSRWCRLKDKKEIACVGIYATEWEVEVEVPMKMTSPIQLKTKLNQILRDALGIVTDDLDEDPEQVVGDTKEDTIRDLVNRRRKELSPEVLDQIKWVLQYKKATSLLSKFGEKMVKLCGEGDYLYPSWFQIGTDEIAVSSGRSSCKNPNMMQMPSRGALFITRWDKDGKPIFYGESGDFQDGIEVLKFFRKSFIAEDGWIFLDADYSQEEPRIAAEICNEQKLIDDFVKFGKQADVHSMFGKSFCNLNYYPKKGEFERDYIGKTGGLQLLYGAWWVAFKDFMYSKTDGKVDWTDAEAEEKYNNFFSDYKAFRREMDNARSEAGRLPESWGWTLRNCKNNRLPYAVFNTHAWGRKRSFHLKSDQMFKPDFMLAKGYKTPILNEETGEPELDENGKPVTTYKNIYRERLSAAGREGFNHTIQGTAADILKEAIMMMEERFEQAGFGWREGIVATIHDEVLVHVKLEHKEVAEAIMKACMTEAWNKYFKRVPIFVDVDSAQNWADAKEPPKKVKAPENALIYL